MRVRLAVLATLSLGLAGLALDMSRSAPRGAGSNHISPVVFPSEVPAGGTLCEPVTGVPAEAASAQLLIGTYGRPVPAIRLSFLTAGGRPVAYGSLVRRGPQGTLAIPLEHAKGAGPATRACLRIGAHARVAVAGEGVAPGPGSETLNGKPHAGLFALAYERPGRETWWQLLPTLVKRFGLGKASFFGDWTLPFLALLLVGVWTATVRLLLRELK
jgi:hypothetical protein